MHPSRAGGATVGRATDSESVLHWLGVEGDQRESSSFGDGDVARLSDPILIRVAWAGHTVRPDYGTATRADREGICKTRSV